MALILLTINARLAPLGDYGGPTQTVALMSDSPAINRGNNLDAPPTDQRGLTRIVGGTIDIGAYELNLVCTNSINPTSQQFTAGGGNITVNVANPAGCTWTASSNASWITVTSGSSGSGNGTVALSVQANTGSARTGTVTIAGQTFTVNQASGCAYSLSATSVDINANGGQVSVNVTAETGCNWTAVSNVSWILAGSTGTGNGTANFIVEKTSSPRSGTLTIAGQTFTVTQAGCTLSVSPSAVTVPARGGTGSFLVRLTGGCQYTLQSTEPWLGIIGTTFGMSDRSFTYSVSSNNTGNARTGTIRVTTSFGDPATAIFTVSQESCIYSLSATSANVTANGGNFSVGITTDCSWTAVSNVPWISISSGATGTGNGAINFYVTPNTSSAPRTGTLTIGGQTYTVNQSSDCAYNLYPISSINISANGGNSSFGLITGADCSYTAVSNNPFITINSGGSGTGTGSISFSVAANTGAARTGTITVGGQTFTVNQASGCAYSLSPTNTTIAAGGGNSSFSINTTVGCPWTATSNDSWITITSTASGTGSGNVSFSVQANSGVARTGTITAANQTFTVNQSGGCSYSLSAATAAFTEAGGNGNVNVFASAGCSYTAVSNNSWITITTGANGTGNGSVTFNVAANTSSSRTGTITIAGQVFIITQSDGCAFTISPANINVGASAGSGSFVVNSGEGCARTAVSNASWVTISSGSTGSGSGFVTFFWSANTGEARFETITVAGLTFTINQAAGNNNARTIYDFDGDGRADISVFRPDSGVWYLLNSASGFTGAQFGIASDKLVPADYDGDGKTDLAVYRNGTWYLQRSAAGFTAVAFGDVNDIPQPADFDGDGKADLAVYRPSNGTWYVFNLVNNQFNEVQFGAATDKPVVGDYNGDGKADLAVYRPSNGTWYIARPTGVSSQNFDSIQFGEATDKPVPADYDGDGRTDVAVFRPSNGSWYLQRSTAGFTGVQFGISTDLPAPADYDGDGKADVAVFRNGTWYLNRSTAGFTGVQFGAATDKPVPNAFVQ